MLFFNISYRHIFLLGLLLCIHRESVAQLEHLRNEIEDIIFHDTDINLKKTPGFHISVIDGDSTYHLGFGSKYFDRSESPSSEDLYELGSISKSFTAILLDMMVEKELLSYDDPVNTHLPSQYSNPRLDELQIRDLVEHTSGLDKRPKFFGKYSNNPQNPYETYTPETLLKYYRNYIPGKDEKAYKYSHSNFALLEIILKKVGKQSYDQLLDQYIFAPLGMTNSYAHQTQEKKIDIAPGYDKADRLTAPWNFKSFAASEGLKSNAKDLSLWVRAQWEDTHSTIDKSIAHCQKVKTEKSLNDHISSAWAWQIFYRERDEYPIYTSSGSTSGHRAFIAYIKETKTAVILLSNSTQLLDNLPILVLRLINYNWDRKT